MSFDERLDQAMRAAANSVEPPVTDLVEGGISRGRQKRRRRAVAATGGFLVATAVVAGGAMALPELTNSPGVVADPGDGEAEGIEPLTAPESAGEELGAAVGEIEPLTAPESTAEQTPLVIEDPNPEVSEDQLDALLEDVAALSGGTFEPLLSGQSPIALVRLDFGSLGTGEVSAYVGSLTGLDEPCDGIPDCEVLLESDTATVIGYGNVVAYEARASEFTNLLVRAATVEVPEGTTVADLGFDNADELRDAILAAVPDAESAERGEFTADDLNDVARKVAGLSTATSGEFVQMDGPRRSGRVSFGEGAGFEIRGSYDLEGNDLDLWTESCERGESDGKPCTELLNTGEIGVFASTYPNQGNRESLRYVADLADGSLVITFDNYMETASGKVVGSSLSGIDPDELVAMVENSGLLDDRNATTQRQ